MPDNTNQRTKWALLRGYFSAVLLVIFAGCNSITLSTPPGAESELQATNDSSQGSSVQKPNSATNTPEPNITNIPTLTDTPPPQYPCTSELCTHTGHFWMARPIAPPDNDDVDFTYRYGSTQNGARPIHHGVEFPNEEGTPVLAAAEGLVIVAGNDYQETYADYPFYYGNLVVIEHHFQGVDEPVFSLYGHLSSVQTQIGASVQAGDLIGNVGYTGIAEWSHLHFEVRVGDNRFRDTRNPELWLQPHRNEGGNLNGAIAGRIVDEFGTPIYVPNVVIERLGPDDTVLETIYVETYAGSSVNGDDQWGENFAIGDLIPGIYRVTLVARGLQVWDAEVFPGALTLLTFDARDL